MAIVLAATGLFLYLRLGSALDGTIEQGLDARAADVAALVEQADSGLREAQSLRGPDNGFAQVVGQQGALVDSTAGLASRPLLTDDQLARARRATELFERTVGDERVRLLALPVSAQDQRLVVVVGTSLEPRDDALADLLRQLLVGGPIALLLASAAGYLLAAASLRPVERMGERAATISAASPGRRLPVPPADDEISRLGGRLNDMLARLEAALERERTLVSNASHELRTPLALMKTEIELALDEQHSAPVLAAALRSAGEETDRLAQLADDLLLLAGVDSGTLPLRRTLVPVAELLDAIATRFRRRAADADRTIEVAVPEGLQALVDRRRLEQALANLVENSLRHGAGTVRLEASEGPGALTLHVTDQGQGSRRSSSHAPSSGSAAPTAPARAQGSGSRSWRRSRRPAGARPPRRTRRPEAPTSCWSFRRVAPTSRRPAARRRRGDAPGGGTGLPAPSGHARSPAGRCGRARARGSRRHGGLSPDGAR